MSHADIAEKLFLDGYNCAQAVFGAFCDVTGMEFETAMKLSSSFGGGMGRLREVCGAVSGMNMVVGMLYGYGDTGEDGSKAEHYALIQSMAAEFKESFGSIICRELLDENKRRDTSHIPDARTAQYYAERPCAAFVRRAAEITDRVIAEREKG